MHVQSFVVSGNNKINDKRQNYKKKRPTKIRVFFIPIIIAEQISFSILNSLNEEKREKWHFLFPQ